jgi:hypothetical protein
MQAVMTGVEGAYDIGAKRYNPPGKYNNWGAVILAQQIQLQVEHNLVVYPVIK